MWEGKEEIGDGKRRGREPPKVKVSITDMVRTECRSVQTLCRIHGRDHHTVTHRPRTQRPDMRTSRLHACVRCAMVVTRTSGCDAELGSIRSEVVPCDAGVTTRIRVTTRMLGEYSFYH